MTWWTTGGVNNGQKSLPREVQDWIAATPPEVRDGGRKPGWHVSSLAYLCPRGIAIRKIVEDFLPKESGFEPKQLVRFDVGTGVHWWWQNCYLGPMQKLVGRWACVGVCDTVVEGKMPKERHDCGVKYARGPGRVFWEYLEPTMSYQEPGWLFPIVGHCDGEIDDTPPPGELDTLGLLELKTANADSMPMREVDPGYMQQIQTYMWLRKKSWAKVVFINPDGRFYNKDEPGMRLSCQQLVVPYDDAYRIKALEKVRAAEAILQEFLKVRSGNGTFKEWPEKICATKNDKPAERCGVASVCFNEVVMKRMAIRLAEGRPVKEVFTT